jgi:hypothetical protein
MEWDTQALLDELTDTYGVIPDSNVLKIRALKVLANSNSPWEDWDAFLYMSSALNGADPSFGNPIPSTPAETAWAVTTMQDIRGDQELSQEVRGMIASIFAAEGFYQAPVKLAFIQPQLDDMNKNMEDRDLLKELAGLKYVDCLANDTVCEGDTSTDAQVNKLLKIDEYIARMYGDDGSVQ